MSSSASLLPSPSVSVPSLPSGNLLSNVPPPTALPSFIATGLPPPSTNLAQINQGTVTTSGVLIPPPVTTGVVKKVDTPVPVAVPLQPPISISSEEPFYPTQFR